MRERARRYRPGFWLAKHGVHRIRTFTPSDPDGPGSVRRQPAERSPVPRGSPVPGLHAPDQWPPGKDPRGLPVAQRLDHIEHRSSAPEHPACRGHHVQGAGAGEAQLRGDTRVTARLVWLELEPPVAVMPPGPIGAPAAEPALAVVQDERRPPLTQRGEARVPSAGRRPRATARSSTGLCQSSTSGRPSRRGCCRCPRAWR